MPEDLDTRTVLSDEEVRTLDAHWRAANYLAAGQIYLLANPLLTEPLRPEHIKPRLLGHWGTSPGLNLVHTHLNRVIAARGLDALCVWGPGHGGPSVLANSWLEGSYTETYPDVGRDAAGMERLFRQFSFPGGVPSHVAPEVPGSIHEGGELGYSLAHAYGAALDHPGLLVACVIGDGEAETGPLAASWHSNKFLDPVHDGAVLPILHLNGYKIANPTVLARLPEAELDALLRGYGHEPIHVSGDDPATVHRAMAQAMDTALDRIAEAQRAAREDGATERHQRLRGDEGARADHRAVEHRGPHADQTVVPDGRAVHHGVVPDGDALAHADREAGVGVERAVVLDVAVRADGDPLDVTAQHGPVPDARARVQRHVPDHRGRGRHERLLLHARLLAADAGDQRLVRHRRLLVG
ncbi:phosphoketolase [Streptomyces griseomycini]